MDHKVSSQPQTTVGGRLEGWQSYSAEFTHPLRWLKSFPGPQFPQP